MLLRSQRSLQGAIGVQESKLLSSAFLCQEREGNTEVVTNRQCKRAARTTPDQFAVARVAGRSRTSCGGELKHMCCWVCSDPGRGHQQLQTGYDQDVKETTFGNLAECYLLQKRLPKRNVVPQRTNMRFQRTRKCNRKRRSDWVWHSDFKFSPNARARLSRASSHLHR